MRWSRVGAVLLLGALAVFAVQGGSYGTSDWRTLRRQVTAESLEVARLRQQVDSLAGYLQRVETDTATQERIARGVFGMLRRGEFMYRIVPQGAPPDSGR